MFLIGGMGNKTENYGEIQGIICKNCGSYQKFTLIRAFGYAHAFFIPILKYSVKYFLICPSCASTYKIPNELGKKLRCNPSTVFDQGLMCRTSSASSSKMFSQSGEPRCTKCGSQISAGDAFCRVCGERIL